MKLFELPTVPIRLLDKPFRGTIDQPGQELRWAIGGDITDQRETARHRKQSGGGEGTADAFICGVTSVERLQRTLHRCAPDGCPPDADFGI